LNQVHGEDFAGAITSISPKFDAVGNLVFVDAGTFCSEHRNGSRLADNVTTVIADEWHSQVPEYAAAKELLYKVMKKIPVVTMTGSSLGRRTAHTFEGIRMEKYSSVEQATTGKRIIYCESSAKATEMARTMKAERLSPFSTYANVARLFELLKGDTDVDVYASYECSEGFNFPFDVVVDSACRLELTVSDAEVVLQRVTVSDVQHVQRAARLRNGGVYHGADITSLRNDVLRAMISDGDAAMREWWKVQLGLPPRFERESVKSMVALLNQVLPFEEMSQSRLEGREWYDKPDPPENSESGSSDVVLVDNGRTGLSLVTTRESERRSKRLSDEMAVGLKGTSSVGRLMTGTDLFSQVRALSPSSGRSLECIVLVGREKVNPVTALVRKYSDFYSGRANYLPEDVGLNSLVAFVDARNDFVYKWTKSKRSRHLNVVNQMKRDYGLYFERRVLLKRFGDLHFLYADVESKEVFYSESLFFLDNVEPEKIANDSLYEMFVSASDRD